MAEGVFHEGALLGKHIQVATIDSNATIALQSLSGWDSRAAAQVLSGAPAVSANEPVWIMNRKPQLLGHEPSYCGHDPRRPNTGPG